ncbi:hypothetical protein [Streptomyces sp. NBC_00102]|uniref:hypothetical protein n=1 Tax=Streptomyces sp. NBC_00102 TaxID=2975652 RepID=UPI00224F2A2C|nr:hypothetical protein [Streptomyces sp. NBC_00102]MCX5395737.1 hypothetical protein [Streptomyces sp. NBC_00102]
MDRIDMDDPQELGTAFWMQAHGFAIGEKPPSPDSPLGRVRAFTAEYPSVTLTGEHIQVAVDGRPLVP